MSISDKARKIPGVAITTRLRDTDADAARAVRTYERARKNRAGVIQAADQRLGD